MVSIESNSLELYNVNINSKDRNSNEGNVLNLESINKRADELNNNLVSNLAGSETVEATVESSYTDESTRTSMADNFIQGFAAGNLDEYDPRAIMIAAEYMKIQDEDDEDRQSLFTEKLAKMGVAGLEQDVSGDIAMQAIEIVDTYELSDDDSSEAMRSDLVDILLLDRDFDSEENKSKAEIDSDALNTVFNLADMEQDFVQVYTISAYTTSTYQTHDSLTVSEMLADFSGQASEHDSWAHNRHTGTRGFSSSEWHNGDRSNDAQLRSLKEKMSESSPELLDLTFNNGEAYIFGEKEDGSIVLLATGDNEQLGKIGRNHLHDINPARDSDVAFNSELSFDASNMVGTGMGGYNGANNHGRFQEYEGTSDITIGNQIFDDINTMSINRYTTPLILDLDGDGLNLSSQADGVQFDLTGDGLDDKTSWTKAQNSFDDAFLVLDKNNNGDIDSGTELFGDQNGASNGFEELAKYDSSGDGLINSDDDVFEDLKLWADLNADGEVDEGEMKSLSELGVTEIDTRFTGKQGDITDEHGNDISMQGSFTRNVNGENVNGQMTDVLFVNRDIQKDEVKSLEDISDLLEKKMGSYAEVMGFHNQTIKSMAVEDDSEIRLSLQEAGKEVQKIVLNNDLADIESEIAEYSAQLARLNNSDTVNILAGSDIDTNISESGSNVGSSNTNNQNNSGANNSNNANKQNYSSDSISSRISELEAEQAAIIGRMAALG